MVLSVANLAVSYHYCEGVHLVSVFCFGPKLLQFSDGHNYTNLRAPDVFFKKKVSFEETFAPFCIVQLISFLVFRRFICAALQDTLIKVL